MPSPSLFPHSSLSFPTQYPSGRVSVSSVSSKRHFVPSPVVFYAKEGRKEEEVGLGVVVVGPMSVVMGSREAARAMAEKEVVVLKRGGGGGGGIGVVGRSMLEVDERRGVEEDGSVSSECSSSIGEAERSVSVSTSSCAVDRGEDPEVQSRWSKGSLESLESLEEGLPIKRGLSSFFNGKSKSFACLSEACSSSTAAQDLAKPENPFNKRRRILVTCRPSWRRRASYGSLLYSCSSSSASASASSSPTVPMNTSTTDLSSLESEDEEEGGVDAYGDGDHNNSTRLSSPSQLPPALLRFHQGIGGGSKMEEGVGFQNKMWYRSPRSFSLSDLRHHAMRKC